MGESLDAEAVAVAGPFLAFADDDQPGFERRACRHHRRFFAPVAATFTTPDGQLIELRAS